MVSVTSSSTDEIIDHYKNHPSIALIREKLNCENKFKFRNISHASVYKKLKDIKIDKAGGFDNISPKFLKIGAKSLSTTLTPIINHSIETINFPDHAKKAEVSPLYKKSDQLDKGNYRPLSILSSTSKIFENVISEQMMEHIKELLSTDLSAYRKNYSCNNVLIKCVENWRKALDDNKHVGCILIDLSKAFDSLPHGLLIAKLHAYGFTMQSCDYLRSYLTNRNQLVKIGKIKSDWLTLKTGVPQGSVTGPLLFNIFINDFIFLLQNECDVSNYADDNTLSFSHHNPSQIKLTLEHASRTALCWFKNNYMKANTSKFQAICFSKDDISIQYEIDGSKVNSESTVKLLGVHIDRKLTFSHHVSVICKKAARQINVLQRLCKYIDFSTKMRIYESFIVSNFLYCSVVYDAFIITNDRKIEKLNERALRLVCNDYLSTYKQILSQSKKSMLYILRKYGLVEQVFKILNGTSFPVKPSFFKIQCTPYSMRDNMKLMKPRYNTVQYGYKSISYQGALLWNNLPVNVKRTQDIQEFKNLLVKCNIFNACQCGSCVICLIDNLR